MHRLDFNREGLCFKMMRHITFLDFFFDIDTSTSKLERQLSSFGLKFFQSMPISNL